MLGGGRCCSCTPLAGRSFNARHVIKKIIKFIQVCFSFGRSKLKAKKLNLLPPASLPAYPLVKHNLPPPFPFPEQSFDVWSNRQSNTPNETKMRSALLLLGGLCLLRAGSGEEQSDDLPMCPGGYDPPLCKVSISTRLRVFISRFPASPSSSLRAVSTTIILGIAMI